MGSEMCIRDSFFLQIQGSGRLRLPDGGVMRIGYESQNGRGYTGIGRLMKDRGLITDGSMQGIVAYLRANPEEGRKVMQENKSFVFFRELTGAGPLGAMGYPVVGEASVAVDVRFIPLGAPLWLSMDRAEPNGIWVAQDTGGAIKGANRIDTFWGAGDRARAIAGGMAARGAALIFLTQGGSHPARTINSPWRGIWTAMKRHCGGKLSPRSALCTPPNQRCRQWLRPRRTKHSWPSI